MTTAVRNSWDLGFYSGSDFRVVLNSSVKMAAKQLTTTNIDEVQVTDETMIISQGTGIATQIDDPTGDITKTTIAAVSVTDADNKVYLLYLGNKPVATAPALGKEGAVGGDARGWKKIRVLRSGSDYKVQYADITSTTHEEIVISKNSAYNFTFLSLIDKKVVSVEPQKNQWDLNFTTFINIIPGTTPTPYFYPDFVTSNLNGNAKAYQVLTSAFTYEAFTLANVDNTKFTADQRNIGSNWRGTSVTGADGIPVSQFVLRTDRFFVIKDPAGNVYKLKFTGGAKADLERGHPSFQYTLLK
ncbi:HmuY family protein [Flavobacterium sp. P21]|uniref:HmuY family protein n=1 Tax=Flavobacterium sp. P21 TaxID=3423948 RepID=UPI003D665D97